MIDKIYLTLRLVLMNKKSLVSSLNAHLNIKTSNIMLHIHNMCQNSFYEWILPKMIQNYLSSVLRGYKIV